MPLDLQQQQLSNSNSIAALHCICIKRLQQILLPYYDNNNNGHQQHQLSAKSAQRMNFIFILFALHFYDCYANALCKKTRWKLKQKQNQLQSGSATRRGIFCLVGVSNPRPSPRSQQSPPSHHKSATAETSPTNTIVVREIRRCRRRRRRRKK